MFGALLGALGPVGWAVGGVITVATIVAASSDDDSYESSTYSNRDEKESNAKEEALAEKNEKICKEINAYKGKRIKHIKQKYQVDIDITNNKKVKFIEKSYIDAIDRTIIVLENETDEIAKLIEELGVRKNERSS